MPKSKLSKAASSSDTKVAEIIDKCLSTLDLQIEEKRGVKRIAKRVTETMRDIDEGLRLVKREV